MFSKSKFFVLFLLALFVFSSSVKSQPVWKKGEFKIFLKDNVLDIFHGESKIIEINSFEFNFVQPYKIVIDENKSDSLKLKLLFNETDGFHKNFPSELPLIISCWNNTLHFYASDKTFNHITIRMKDLDEHYFGLIEKLYPHNSKNPDLRGNVVDVDVYGYGNLDYAENYSSAYSAFYMSSNGYASFFDTFVKGRYQFAINGITEIYHQTGKLDWYIFYGPTGDKIHKEYFDVIGKPKFVPIWACGPIFWRDQNNGGKDEILDDIQKFNELKIPLTACWVDRPYSNGSHEWSKMDFSNKFSGPEKWIKKINDYGLEFMTWVGPLTMTDKDFPGLLPNYKGYIDLTNPDALKEFESRLSKYQYSVGVRGHKMDRSDENFPFTAKWYKPVSESESRNKYVYLYSKVIDKFLSDAYGKDQFNFARAAFHRCQPFLSALWGGDSRNNWQGMAGSMANAVRCGFMGFPVWGGDTGGYLGEGWIDEDLYIRWLEWSAWCGMFEVKIDGAGGRGKDRPPWKYSKQLQNVYRSVSEQRMNFLPYTYSFANTSYENGVLMKPLTYMYPDDKKTFKIWDEYIYGNAFLVAPVFTKDNKREIYLPEGEWYEFDNSKNKYVGPLTITKDVSIENIPVFIKGNSIFVTGNIFQGSSRNWENDLNGNEEITIHLFPGNPGDKTSFSYIDYLDNNKEKEMDMIFHGEVQFTSESLMTKTVIEIKCNAKPKKILLNNNPVDFAFDEVKNIAKVHLEKNVPINLKISN